MPRARIATSPSESRLLRQLIGALPLLRARLAEHAAWEGVLVHDSSRAYGYERVTCREQLAAGRRRFGIAVHRFARGDHDGALHDHRWPLAVLPLDLAGRAAIPLYEMPWEVRAAGRVVTAGALTVRSGSSWAIERCREVFHAVRSLAPHLSIVLSDHTEPAARALRLEIEPLAPDATRDVLAAARTALAAHGSPSS